MGSFETNQERHERLADSRRGRALRELFEGQVTGEPFFRAVAMLLVDATLDGDEVALDIGLRELQRAYAVGSDTEERGRFLGLMDFVGWASERTLPLSSVAEFEVSSHAHEFLKAVLDEPGQDNGQLASRLGTSDAEISRVGSRLMAAGVAVRHRIGRRNYWDITPRGVQTLELLEQGGVSRPTRPHRAIV